MKDIVNNITSNFTKLTFDEEKHQYSVDGVKLKGSVSSKVDKFVKKTDFGAVAQRIAVRDNIPVQSILQEWEKEKELACTKGNRVHLFGELYVFDRTLKPTCKQEEAIVKFWNDLPDTIVPVTMELRMFHKEFMFAGTADILLYNTVTETFIIGDYKTNKDLFKNFKKQKMLGPFDNMLDCAFNKYQLQLSYYQILFEQTGLKVSSRKLIWLLPDGTYKMYNMDDHTEVLKQELKTIKL